MTDYDKIIKFANDLHKPTRYEITYQRPDFSTYTASNTENNYVRALEKLNVRLMQAIHNQLNKKNADIVVSIRIGCAEKMPRNYPTVADFLREVEKTDDV